MRIQHNIMAMNAYRNLGKNNGQLSKNLEKLSSGFRINRAGDDAAGLAISEKMRAQIAGLDQAQKNAQSGINLVQTAEGALTEVHDMLNRMVTLSTQAANGTYSETDRAKIQSEINALSDEIDRIAENSNFNGTKLLDGSLGALSSDSLTIADADSVNFGDGVTTEATNGEGAKSQFKISLDKAFSAGDTITLSFNVPNADGGVDQKSLTLTHQDAAITNTDTGLTFSGKTVDDQLNSIMARLQNGTDTTLGGTLASIFGTTAGTNGYTVTKDGNSLVVTANAEGKTNKLHLNDVSVSNKDASLVAAAPTTAASANTGAAANNGVNDLLSGTQNFAAGDRLKFEFMVNGQANSVTLTLDEAMLEGDDSKVITERIVDALKNANFDTDSAATTGVDETGLKVSDLFDVAANTKNDGTADTTGSIQIKSKATLNATAGGFKFTDVKLALKDTNSFNSVGTVVSTDNTAGAGAVHTRAYTVGTENMAVGDKFVMQGTLADGRSFSVELTAGSLDKASINQFAVGATADATMTNLAAVLEGGCDVKVTDFDGSEITMKGSDIFGTGKTFDVTAGTSKLEIANGVAGTDGVKGLTGTITSVAVNVAGAVNPTGEQIAAGAEKTKAETTLTFEKDKMEYGTAVTIGEGANAKTFELVESADSAVTEEGNIKVVVADLAKKSSADIAAAFKEAINTELKDSANKYTQWAVDIGVGDAVTSTATNLVTSTTGSDILTLKTHADGSAAKAIKAETTYGENKNMTIGYNTDENGAMKLKEGDTIKINGKTYQFDTDIRKVKDGNNFIKVSDFSNTEEIANAIKLAVETDDPSLSVTVNDDNSVTVSGKLVNGKYVDPKIEQTLVGGGMTLQIGSEAVETIGVQIDSMKANDLGIRGLDIGDPDKANAAIQTVKDAIEKVSVTRGNLGAVQNRLEHTINNLGVMEENIQDAEANIRDTDIADEMMNYTKNNILIQSAQAMLAQANQAPQGVLQLMG